MRASPSFCHNCLLTLVDVLVDQVVGIDLILRDGEDPAGIVGRNLQDRRDCRDVVGSGTVEGQIEALQVEEAVSLA